MKLYESKAKIYHDWMKVMGKDYKKEAKLLAKLIKSKIAKKEISIFDLACGTGEHALSLKRLGFDVSCGDLSDEMVSIARKKLGSCKKVDMKSFKLNKKVDVITCMFNSIFYLKASKELTLMLQSCYSNLKEDGLLIIEITNPKILNKLSKSTNSWKLKDCEIIMESELRPPKLIQDFIIKDSKGTETKEKHHLNVFPLEEIKKIMKEIGFQDIETKGENKLHIITSK